MGTKQSPVVLLSWGARLSVEGRLLEEEWATKRENSGDLQKGHLETPTEYRSAHECIEITQDEEITTKNEKYNNSENSESQSGKNLLTGRASEGISSVMGTISYKQKAALSDNSVLKLKRNPQKAQLIIKKINCILVYSS